VGGNGQKKESQTQQKPRGKKYLPREERRRPLRGSWMGINQTDFETSSERSQSLRERKEGRVVLLYRKNGRPARYKKAKTFHKKNEGKSFRRREVDQAKVNKNWGMKMIGRGRKVRVSKKTHAADAAHRRVDEEECAAGHIKQKQNQKNFIRTVTPESNEKTEDGQSL